MILFILYGLYVTLNFCVDCLFHLFPIMMPRILMLTDTVETKAFSKAYYTNRERPRVI